MTCDNERTLKNSSIRISMQIDNIKQEIIEIILFTYFPFHVLLVFLIFVHFSRHEKPIFHKYFKFLHKQHKTFIDII